MPMLPRGFLLKLQLERQIEMADYHEPGYVQCEICKQWMPKRFLVHHWNQNDEWCEPEIETDFDGRTMDER